MVVESLINVFFRIFSGIINALPEMPSLSLVGTVLGRVSDFTGYGAYIVGRDILLLLLGSVGFWWSFKAGWGLVVYLWRLLPLT